MGSYYNIETSVRCTFFYVTDLFCSPESAHIINGAWIILQSGGKRIIMLQGKYSGRDKHSNLLAICYRFESSAYCNFSLSESNIATHQPVHGARIFHVAFYCHGSQLLIGSIFEHK